MDLPTLDDDGYAYHAIGGAAVGAVSVLAVEHFFPEMDPLAQRVVALIPVVVLGVAKEIADHQDPEDHCADWKDAAATVAGGMLSIEIMVQF